VVWCFHRSLRTTGLFKSFILETELLLSCFPRPARHNHISKPHKSRLIMSCQQKTSRSKLHHRAASCTSTRCLQLLLCKLLARCIHIHSHIHIHIHTHFQFHGGGMETGGCCCLCRRNCHESTKHLWHGPCHMHMQLLLRCADIICDEVLYKICTWNGAEENGKRQNNNGIPLIFTPLHGEVPSQPDLHRKKLGIDQKIK